MTEILSRLQALVKQREVHISRHGFRELAADDILHEAKEAMTRNTVEFVVEGKYAAEVAVALIEEEGGWSPYFSLEDARKLEAVRLALRQGDLPTATKYGRVFELLPVSA